MTSQDFLLYVLKISLLSGIFLGYYWMALRNKRFHHFNRFYLLASLLLSLLLPLVRFDWVSSERPVFIGSGESIDIILSPAAQANNAVGFEEICLLFLLLVSIFLIATISYRIYKIYRIKEQSEINKLDGFDLMYTDEESAPFSFLDNLFWKRSISIDDEGGKQIFKHELTHIQQKHTWDRLFSQLCCSLFWINPFYWLIQKELETIHEFIADEAAIANHDIESFAKMLLQAHYGNHFFETKHSFFYSSIKRRLTMLTTTNNTRFSYLRRVMLLPILLISISIFSVRVQAAKEKIEKKMTAISETIFQKKIDTTKPPPPPPSLNILIREKNKLVIINGKEASKEDLGNNLNPIDFSDIKFLNVEEATKKYGSKGKFGAIEITKRNSATKNKVSESFKTVTINGKKVNVSDASLNFDNKSFDKVFTAVQEPASFPGGAAEWRKYLEKNLNRDLPVKNGAGPGKYVVNLSFLVDKNGAISKVKIINDPGYGAGEEAKRMIELGPKWIPAKQNGHAVNFLTKQSITFLVSAE